MAKIIGMSEFKKQCRFVKRELGAKLNRQVANAGAMLARNEARRIAPFHDITGAARKAIVTKERRSEEEGKAIAQIGFRLHGVVRKRKGGSVIEASAFYVKFFESGTQKHTINRQGAHIQRSGPFKGAQLKARCGGTKQQKARLALHFGGAAGGLVLFRYSVVHPGMPAKPFLKRALNNATGAIYKRRDDLVEKAVMRVAANRSASTIGR